MTDLGVSITIEGRSLDEAIARVAALVSFDPSDLMASISRVGLRQTRRRVKEEKTAPDGTPWAPIRDDDHPILEESGLHILGRLGATSSADEAEWGCSWEFAHVHQFGAMITAKNARYLTFRAGGRWARAKSVTIPARPFVGLSDENRREIDDLVTDHFGRLQR